MSNLPPRSPAFYTVFTNLQETLQKVSFLRRNILWTLSFHVARKVEKKGMLSPGRASLRASPFIRKYQRLVLDYGVPIAVLHDMVAVSNENFVFAHSGMRRVILVERTTTDDDLGNASCRIDHIQRIRRGNRLEGTALNLNRSLIGCISDPLKWDRLPEHQPDGKSHI